MKKTITITIALIIFTQLTLVAVTPSNKITILHTNDIHGNFLPRTIKAKNEGQTDRDLGGFLALYDYVTKIRKQQENVLLLDAGDFMTGNPICDIEVKGAKGGGMMEFFNLLKYDGQTCGNHEFDVSLDNIRKLIEIANHPVYSANLFTTDGSLFTNEPYHIYKKGDLSVGIIGAIVDDLPVYINAPQRDQVKLKPAVQVIDSLAKIIDAETDLIVVLSHCGLEEDEKIAAGLGQEVDAIIGGHSHTRMKEAKNINGILIVQAGSHLANVGQLELTVEDDRISSHSYKLVPLWNEDITPEPELAGKVKFYDEQIKKEYGRVIGTLETSWRRAHFSESNIGNFMADLIRDYGQADIGGINSGGIRANLNAGPIKKLDIKNILPFNNTVTVVPATGKDVLDFVKLNAGAAAYERHGILQISGLNYEFTKAGENEVKILNVTINGEPLDLEKTYKFATVDFVAANAEKYLGFEPKETNNLLMPLSDLAMQVIEKKGNVKSKIEGRMVKK